jgi:integrase-like protein
MSSWSRSILHPCSTVECRRDFPDANADAPEPEGAVPVCTSVFVRNHLRKAAIAAGAKIPNGYRFGLHNLRHSLSNWLVKSGTEVKTVQTMLRHSRSQTTLDLYAQGDNDNKITAQDKFCGLIVDQPAGAVDA